MSSFKVLLISVIGGTSELVGGIDEGTANVISGWETGIRGVTPSYSSLGLSAQLQYVSVFACAFNLEVILYI